MNQQSLEERVEYLEQNIHVLNKALTDIAVSLKDLLDENQTRSAALSNKLEVALEDICPFPPGC